MLKHVRLRMQYDDMTGVLMQRISRIPLSYRRITKNPGRRGLKFFQIVALHRCHRGAALPSMNGLSDFLARFQHHSE